MVVSYKGLWKTLIENDMQKSDLVKKVGLSSATVAKMGKNEPVSPKVLDKMAVYFGCSVSDIIKYE